MKNIKDRIIKEGWDGEPILDNWGAMETDSEAASAKIIPDPRLKEISRAIYETDIPAKALTGRTPEKIQAETGIPSERMFPKDAKILYVGDPWQKMAKTLDSPNLTVVDYEYGDVASFINDDQLFRYNINARGEQFLGEVNFWLQRNGALSKKDRNWLSSFGELLAKAQALSVSAKSDEEYKQAAEAWQAARIFIEERYQADLELIDETKQGDPGEITGEEDALASLRREAWYACVYGQRGFADIPDWRSQILPEVNRQKNLLAASGVTGEELTLALANLTRQLIEKLRLKKFSKESKVVQAMFPLLPFEANSFDRFIASWSISAHTFGFLTKEEFKIYWQEISRVLKANGEAYIFPLHYGGTNVENLENSLRESGQIHETGWKYYNQNGEEVPDFYDAETLWLKKQAK